MAELRIKWNDNALYEIRSDPKLIAEEDRIVQQIASTAGQSGGTYATSSRQGERRPQGRWRAAVVTADYKAIRENAANNTIMRALGSIR